MEAIKKIYIYGKSGHGKVVADIALANGYVISGWIDDDPNKESLSWENFNQTIPKGASIALGIGDNLTRSAVIEKILQMGYSLPVLIHPSAVVSPTTSIQQGSIIMPLCVINANSHIGMGVIINSASIIEHDCIVEDFVHISPNVALAGNVKIGSITHIGIGSTIIQNITIGDNVIIGAGSVVIKAIPPKCTAVGIPCKVIRT